MTNKKDILNSESGFSLIECMIALIVTMIGVLAVAVLMVVGIRLQLEARNAIEANAIATTKLEELYNSSPASTVRAPGGSLTADVALYNDTIDTRFRRRWQIEAAGGSVPLNTQRITVSIVANRPDVLLPAVSITTLVPGS